MENKWDIEIKPKKKLLDVDIKGICNNVNIPDNTLIWAYA